MRKRIGLFAYLLTLSVASPAPADDSFFEKQIRPVLVERCYACHSGTKSKGGLSLDTAAGIRRGGESGPAVVPGKTSDSLLIEAINYRSLKMPPPEKGGKLSSSEIAALTKWVASGAVDPRGSEATLGGMNIETARNWWAFRPLPAADKRLEKTLPGEGKSKSKADPQRIDQFLKLALDAQSMRANPPCDKRTLLRRATYDLTGLPPTEGEMRAFLNDDSASSFDAVVERLLASPQYGVKWGRSWLDVVRYADTAGENTDRPLPHAWRYRNWVIQSFNRDLPYDEFVRLQISGDILRAEAPESARNEGIIATGYLAIARRFGHDIDKDVHLMHEDVIDNLGKNFLGLALGCARCHDHKYDPISAEDYYALYGIFDSTRFSFPGCEPKGQPRDLVPLKRQSDIDALQRDYKQRLAKYEQAKKGPADTTGRLQQLAGKSHSVLAQGQVPEGKSVPVAPTNRGGLARIAVRKNEVLQLAVLPNGSHGADTTRLQWQIRQQEQPNRTWSLADLVPRLTSDGPYVQDRGATWCFLEITNGPVFLYEKQNSVNGKPGLNAWRIGDTPSVLVNAASQPVSVWTILPASTFFVHPGPQRPVAVAWVCPQDGTYRVEATVADAHPSGGDGVSFRFEHFASADYGAGLIELAKTSATDLVKPEPPVFPVAYAAVESKPKNARLHQRGDPELPGDEVPRRWLSVFGGEVIPKTAGSGRRRLADWISEHPLAARVMVNRIWQGHFGRGLVSTPNDFGSRGAATSHPELLDWLAAEFRAGGYSVKAMHRLIMKSAAYQRSSQANHSAMERDPANKYLAGFSRRRLTAEEIRDTLLIAAGDLDFTAGGPHPFPPPSSWSFTQHNPFVAVYQTNRRSAYLMVQRQRRHPYLALFDGADPNSSTGVRQVTTVATQALYFLNDPFFHKQGDRFAQRVLKSPPDARLNRAYHWLYQRYPTAAERGLASQFLTQYPGNDQQKWAAYARVLLASNELLYLD